MTYKFNSEVHAHTLDGAPLYGTSTVVKEVMPPFLAKWGAQCAVDFTKKKIGDAVVGAYDETEALYELLDESVGAWTKVRKDAATKGTDLHKDLEDYVQLCIEKFGGAPQVGESFTGKVGAFAEWANSNVETFLWSEVHCYSKELWVGGIIDCVAKLRTGEIAIIDFKSSKEVYFNHLLQAAGYAAQCDENGLFTENGQPLATKNSINSVGALVVVPFGSSKLNPVKVTNVVEFKEAFAHLVAIYKLQLAFKNR